jgi:hypothetical protein
MMELQPDIACAVFSSPLMAMSVLEQQRSMNPTRRAPQPGRRRGAHRPLEPGRAA